jgi:hypothetical protein
MSALIVARFVDSEVQPTRDVIGLTQTVSATPTSVVSTMAVNISSASKNDGSVKIFVPSWTQDGYAGVPLLAPIVNGRRLPAANKPVPGQYAVVKPPRPSGWLSGDIISMELPCPLRLRKLDDNRTQYRSMYSFVVGDVLLVGIESTLGASNRLVVPTLANVTTWVKVSVLSNASTPLRYVAQANNRDLELMPLNEVVHERYSVYYNISLALR